MIDAPNLQSASSIVSDVIFVPDGAVTVDVTLLNYTLNYGFDVPLESIGVYSTGDGTTTLTIMDTSDITTTSAVPRAFHDGTLWNRSTRPARTGKAKLEVLP